MKILVTGSAGFIGFHVVNALLKQNENIIVGIDNINSYYDVQLKYDRLAEAGINKNEVVYGEEAKSKKNNNYSFIQLALEDTEKLNLLFQKEKFDVVINLAAQAGVRYSIENPYAYIDSNVKGFLNILECCKSFRIKHLIYASSSSVYGLNKSIPFSVDDKTDSPISLYAATKKSNELMAHVYSYLFKMPVTGLRFFTVYGSWSRPDMAPSLFAKAIMAGEKIKVFNNGEMERDFTHVDDIVKGIIATVYSKKTADQSNLQSDEFYNLYNIGNSAPVKLMDFIQVLEKEIGIEAKKEMLPLQPGDMVKTFADTSNFENDYQYAATVSLEAGVKNFVDWFKGYYKHAAIKNSALQ